MPSFFPRSMGRHQLPLTPPEYPPSYSGNHYSSMPYQSYAQAAAGLKTEGTYDYANRHSTGMSYQQALPSMMYPAPTAFPTAPTNTAQTTQFYGNGKTGPILPPLATSRPPSYEQATAADMLSHMAREEAYVRERRSQSQSKAEKPVGGVSATLDYEMETMTDFVTEMAHGIIQLGSQQNVDPTFRKWVHQVLCATRLPSATILLSLHYLSLRMTQLSQGDQRRSHQGHQRQRMLTVALILGSKFLDDNTFINRSWAEVSGIEVSVLNWMEIDWFQAMDHKLHRDPKENRGFESWMAHWKDYERHVNMRNSNSTKLSQLSQLDTNVQQYQKNGRTSWSPMYDYHAKRLFGPLPDPMPIDTPAYTPHDHAWLYPLAANETSPPSAPHTGPTTPEYYNSAAPNSSWAGHEGYSRRTMFGFPPSQANQSQAQQQYNYYSQNLLPPPGISYGHAFGCSCMYCNKSPTNYFLGHSSFGQAMPVAG